MFFLPNVTTPTCFFSKFHKNEKSLQPIKHVFVNILVTFKFFYFDWCSDKEQLLHVHLWVNFLCGCVRYWTLLISGKIFHSYHVPELQCGGKKTHIPPLPVSTFVQPISWLTSWSRDWLIATGGWGSWPRSLTHTNTIRIHQPKKLSMSKSVYYSFYPWVSPFATHVILLFLYAVLAWWIASLLDELG